MVEFFKGPNGFIHNLSKSLDIEICGYLQDAGFLRASRILGGCKLDPTLINALVERWRPKTHTFHLPCGECTITLEDVALQFSLSIDGSVITRLAVILGKEDICETFLRRQLNRIRYQSVVSCSCCIMGLVAATIFTSLSEQPIYVPIEDKVEPWAELRGTTRTARKYLAAVRSTLGSQKIFGHSKYVGCKCTIDNARNDGDARIRSSDVTIWVEATNFAVTMRHGNTAQVGSLTED
ncbi:hypothetical protein CXB51_028546 [Gossypium anomalum]|uniref:Aminotransferase-like plant mobile domain-containing protein n=1 Tax=Gossypium anomalum TaxID=47600 RepID=A0A8J5Y0D5_9ROSI|nr:hypothetical protein CXB51_028546 [Gossypium anomalum]